MRWWGEEIPALGFFLYIPQQFWLLPAVVLAPISALFRPATILVYAMCFFVDVVFLMGFRWSPHTRPPTGPTITVVTNNRGQDNGTSLMPFLEAEKPDILVCQEDGRGDAFSRVFPDRFCLSHGEFTIVSKFPIKNSGLLESPNWEGGAVAAWFEVEFQGEPLMVYSVHMPTPRSELYKMRGPGLIAATLPLPGNRFAKFKEQSDALWKGRVKLATELAAVFAKDSRRQIIAGDFNMPRPGRIYPMFGSLLHDSFEECGRGCGFTLPGVTRNPLSLYGPWMRIDYVFANRRFRPYYVRTELHRHSQHRAVAARFELLN